MGVTDLCDTQTPKTVFFQKKMPVVCGFFAFFSPPMMFFYNTMTSNAFLHVF